MLSLRISECMAATPLIVWLPTMHKWAIFTFFSPPSSIKDIWRKRLTSPGHFFVISYISHINTKSSNEHYSTCTSVLLKELKSPDSNVHFVNHQNLQLGFVSEIKESTNLPQEIWHWFHRWSEDDVATTFQPRTQANVQELPVELYGLYKHMYVSPHPKPKENNYQWDK